MNKNKFIKIAKDVINLEIRALSRLKNNLDNSFNLAVEKIVKCQSKIILCGVGKSGLIANKIAATLSSVGTPSFYLSASDSSHGDLGSVSKKDILILISNSLQKALPQNDWGLVLVLFYSFCKHFLYYYRLNNYGLY